MSSEVVLDIETQNTFEEAGAYDHTLLKISVIGVYFYETDEYICYEEAELPKLWKRLETAGRIIGYNTKGFDYNVMNVYYAGDFQTFPSLDLLEVIAKSLGFRVKLDDVAHATLGHGKTAHGLQAVEWWKQGKIQEIKDYCLSDVKVTKEVYEFGKKYGIIRYYDRLGVLHEVPVDFKEKVEAAPNINLTMGF
ncbi:MAG: ribonuclease H-like domain-containing protein [Patescibacteria group bacterium]